MSEIGVGIVGLGTIGGGVVKVLRDRLPFFRDKLGLPLRLARAAELDTARFEALEMPPDVVCSADAADILNDGDIAVVLELVGGTTFARKLVLDALERGKHVVTANKALLAEHGPEIFQAATANGVSVYFEAAVGGGMPIIKALREGMIANDIISLKTIINGTCNYVLSEMSAKGLPFDTVLKTAQENGFAEADPTLDVGGFDTGHKVAIMASLAHGGYVAYDSMSIEGITSITQDDIRFARELGYTLKLLGIIETRDNGVVDVRVHPAMLHTDHILSSVNGVFNAVWLKGDAVGDILLYGKGAGELPTASAVVADLIECARDITSAAPQRIAMDFYSVEKRMELLPSDAIRTRYYLRFSVVDKPGVLAGITSVFGTHDISIASIVQKEGQGDEFVPVILLTHEACEKNVKAALADIDTMEFVRAKTQLIRIEE